MNDVTPAFTWVIEAPIEFDSSMTSAIGPPQRLRASANDGAPWMLLASMTERVVPPAVMLIWLMPPPAPGSSPPPLMVTTTRLAFLMYESVGPTWVSFVASAASGSLTRMTQRRRRDAGDERDRRREARAGRAARWWSRTPNRRRRSRSGSATARTSRRRPRRSGTTPWSWWSRRLPTSWSTSGAWRSTRARIRSRGTSCRTVTPAGFVSTVTADARSAGTHMPMVCSARATLKRPSVAGCWRNTTVSDVASAETMAPTTITDTSNSGRVMPHASSHVAGASARGRGEEVLPGTACRGIRHRS